ncbi:MAG: hypothetical protein AMXMBFR53_21290 [Gemmatimonadota bacterium]
MALENLALRQQFTVLQRQKGTVRLKGPRSSLLDMALAFCLDADEHCPPLSTPGCKMPDPSIRSFVYSPAGFPTCLRNAAKRGSS